MSSHGNMNKLLDILEHYSTKNTLAVNVSHSISINNELNNYSIPDEDINNLYIEIYNDCLKKNYPFYIQEYIINLFPFYIKLNINPNNLINKTMKKSNIKKIITCINNIITANYNFNDILAKDNFKCFESYILTNSSEIMYIIYPHFVVSKTIYKEIYKELYSSYNEELNKIFYTEALENDKSNILYRNDESIYFYTYGSTLRDTAKYKVSFIYENNELIKYDNRYSELDLLLLLSYTNKNNNTLINDILDVRYNNHMGTAGSSFHDTESLDDNIIITETKNNRKDILLKSKLKHFKLIDKDQECSHTSLSQGKYYIDNNNLEAFYDLQYNAVFVNEEASHIVERRLDNHPLIIDLDFRQKIMHRSYNENNVLQFISLLNECILDVINVNKNKIQAFILEKSYNIQKKHELYKDGIHIIYPYIYCNSYIQLYIRDLMLKHSDKILNIFPFHCESIEDLYDESIIKPGKWGNGWFVYGSSKTDYWPYVLSYILDYKLNKIECNYTNRELISLFSMRKTDRVLTDTIHNKHIEFIQKKETTFKNRSTAQKNKVAKKKSSTNKLVKNKITNHTLFNKQCTEEDLKLIIEMVDNLNPKRADNFEDWIRVCWCLYNIDYDLLPTFINFSKKSSKFESEDDCNTYWDNSKKEDTGGLKIGTLVKWLQEDNPIKYSELKQNDKNIYDKIIESKAKDTYHASLLLYSMLNGYGTNEEITIVCTENNKNPWFIFNNGCWKADEGSYLKKYISTKYAVRFSTYFNEIGSKISESIMNSEEHLTKQLQEKSKLVINYQIECNNITYKEKLLKECQTTFRIPNDQFFDKFNENPQLIGFNNGVYDLDNDIFRAINSMDLLSFSTGLDYDEEIEEYEVYEEVWNFIRSILPNPNCCNYVLTQFAANMCGIKRDEAFHFLIGNGSNGKSLLIKLYKTALGSYLDNLDISHLTQKRASSGAAAPQIAGLKGKRVVILQEPEGDEKMNMGLVKELTGNDIIKTRNLFESCISFRPQWGLFCVTNGLPDVNSTDDGTWRRLRVIRFTEKFTDDPEELKLPHHHPRDTSLGHLIETHDWGVAFIHILFQYYKKYKQNNFKITVPIEITEEINNYKAENDILFNFIMTQIEFSQNSKLKIQEIKTKFKNWLRDENINTIKNSIPRESVIIEKIISLYPKLMPAAIKKRNISKYPTSGFLHLRFIESNEFDNIDLDDDDEEEDVYTNIENEETFTEVNKSNKSNTTISSNLDNSSSDESEEEQPKKNKKSPKKKSSKKNIKTI